MLPKHIKSWNIFVDARGYAGVANKVKLPKLERAMEEWKAGGMGGPIKLDFGMKGLELGFSLGEFNPNILSLWGVTDPSGIGSRWLGAAGDGSSTEAWEISVRGRFETMDFGTAEAQKMIEVEHTMPLTYYKLSRNGVVLIEHDLLSGKEVVNGTDLTAALMQALGFAA